MYPSRNGDPWPIDAEGRLSVLVELHMPPGGSASHAMGLLEGGVLRDALAVDYEYQPVWLPPPEPGTASAGAGDETYVIRGTVDDESAIAGLHLNPVVAAIWIDTPIAPFGNGGDVHPEPVEESGATSPASPIQPCDLTPNTPKGSIADVATYLGVNHIWSAGFRGAGMVVGVVDGGITAGGRPVKTRETIRRIPRVIGGWPADWGTEAGQWGEHGNMCAADVLGMAPEAHLYDFRIAGPGGSPGTISRALQAFQWAIDSQRLDGRPHVLTNGWGIFQEGWDSDYARNPNHPFTRKVVQAINEGILVLFAAGNSGATAPDSRAGSDVGRGRSIWGANGHRLVMTAGAANKDEMWIGYGSEGPAALDKSKPDFCSISHFTGYFESDSGTSAAVSVLAGVAALLKQSVPSATQADIKACLSATAKDIGPPGWDEHSGAGIIQALDAFRHLQGSHGHSRPSLWRRFNR